MKVETGLKSGAMMQDAATAATQAAGSVQNFFTQASQQANTLTSRVVGKATAVWNALVSG